MSLEHILLGMLRDPASGYDLRKDFDGGPRHFWSAELSQIYPTLQRMERRGWVSSRRVPSERGPDRREYRRTRQGARALRDWLRGEADIGTERLAWIGQLVFLGELRDPATTLQFLNDLRSRLLSLQQELEAAERSLREAHLVPPEQWDDDDFHELLCLRLGVRTYEGRVSACDECIALVRTRRKGKEHGDAG